MPDPPVRLVRAGPLESGLTQGIYHALSREMKESSQDTIILCSPKTPYLCIGYHQVLDAVLDNIIQLGQEVLQTRQGRVDTVQVCVDVHGCPGDRLQAVGDGVQ